MTVLEQILQRSLQVVERHEQRPRLLWGHATRPSEWDRQELAERLKQCFGEVHN